MTDTLRVTGGELHGIIQVPGDKSISHRAAIFAALARGPGEIDGFLDADDCNRTLAALAAMGVAIERPAPTQVRVHGIGNGPFQAPAGPLDLGNSGTGLRLLAGVLAGRGVPAQLTGDASLVQRPMDRIVEPLARMGAAISARDGHAPVTLGGGTLHAAEHVLPVASAQVKSALLLAGLHTDGTTWVESPAPSRDHTERLMAAYGIPLAVDGLRLGVTRCDWDGIPGRAVEVPGDISSAAFFAVGAALVPGSEVSLADVGANPLRTGFLEVLRRMGAEVAWQRRRDAGGEPCGDLVVRGAALRGTRIGPDEIPGLIDELPALMVAAACARGRTVLAGAGELRYKESDRLKAMAEGLAALGAEVEETHDGLIIDGGALLGGTVDARGDHRMAMAFAMAGLRSGADVTITDCARIATSFPGFEACARGAGLEMEAA